MPPKGKKGKAKQVLIDGVDTSAMTRDQLEAFALKLKDEMEREREERNFFQMERDKIRTYWEITRDKYDNLCNDLRVKDLEIEKIQQISDIESKEIKQQMKYLQFENNTKISEVRAEAMAQLKLAEEDYVNQEMELLKDKQELRKKLHENEEAHEMQIQRLKMENLETVNELRTRFERELKDMERLHEEKTQELKNEIELIYRMQMFEVEERKNTQIHKLIEDHDTAFNDMKNYYNDITLNNLGLISALKEQMEALRKQAERSERTATDVLQDNRKMKEPLEQAQTELALLKRKLEFYERDKAQLSRLKARNAYVEKQLQALTWETEVLLQRNETLVEQRTEMKDKFNDVVIELQQKTDLRNVLLERELAELEVVFEKQEQMMAEAFETCQTLAEETNTIVDIPEDIKYRAIATIEEKNFSIQEMKFELSRLTKAYDELVQIYESKLAEYGIPKEDLGFQPYTSRKRWCYIPGPTGLVTKNK